MTNWFKLAGIATVTLIILLLVFIVIIPGLRGYAVAKQLQAAGVSNIDDLVSQNNNLKDQLAKAQSDLAASQQALAAAQQEFSANMSADQDKLALQGQQIQALKDEVSTKQTANVALASDMDKQKTVLENAANRLCCIARFTNSAINAYTITDANVACVSEGGTAISCS